jgi:hypothetical protein
MAKAKSEARKFLLGHLAATTIFAGTLGLPFATLFAAAFDKLKDAADDDGEPSNIQAAWRNWLSDVLGHDAEEVIAKGAPRALGVDISTRVSASRMFSRSPSSLPTGATSRTRLRTSRHVAGVRQLASLRRCCRAVSRF